MKDELIDNARLFCNQKQTNNYSNNGKTPADVYNVLPDEWIDDATFLQQKKNKNENKNDNDKNKDDDDDDDDDRRSNKY